MGNEAVWVAARTQLRGLLRTHPTRTNQDLAAALTRSISWVKKWRARLQAAPVKLRPGVYWGLEQEGTSSLRQQGTSRQASCPTRWLADGSVAPATWPSALNRSTPPARPGAPPARIARAPERASSAPS
jgi:hypothetical protein